MPTRKIFVVGVEENSKNQSTKKDGRKASKSGICKSSYTGGLHVFTILCCCILAMSILTLVPRHNSILEPAHWFEVNIPSAIACFIMTTVTVLDFIVIFERNSLVTIQFFLKTYLTTYLTVTTCYCTIYMIWTMILEYNHPMPYVGVLVIFPLRIVSMVSLPEEFRILIDSLFYYPNQSNFILLQCNIILY